MRNSEIDRNRVSMVLETNLGGVGVTLCGCGVLCLASMAHIHADQCPTFLAAVAEGDDQ